MIALQQLEPEAWAILRTVRLRALAEAPGNFFRSLSEEQGRPETHWRDMLANPAAAIFMLFDGEEPIGLTGVFTDRDDPTGATAEFGMTWLAPAYRGRGLSSLFYQERIAWARTAGHGRVRVSHRADNLASGRAMHRASFVLVGRRTHRWPDGATPDDLLYELKLRA